MKRISPKPTPKRVKVACATGAAGWVVSIGMVYLGRSMSYGLPEFGFHAAAFCGASIAGYILTNGFGRTGYFGLFISSLCACIVTFLGTMIGGWALFCFTMGDPVFGAPLSVVVVIDASMSL